MWTKHQIIKAALTEIGMGEYVHDAQPEELMDALSRLDALMAEWEGQGIVTGYLVIDGPSDDILSGDSGIRSQIVRAVISGLAVEIAPMFGKTPSPQTTSAAKRGFGLAIAATGGPPSLKANITSSPAGAGWRFRLAMTMPEE